MGDSGGVVFEGFLDGSYDCVDRVVLRAYFQLGQRAAGFRMWWRRWQGSDEGLNNTRLMRVAGRFARRVKGWAKGAGVPVVYSKGGERNEDLARGYVPDEAGYEGVFVVIVGRAPGNVWDVEHTADGRIRRIKRKVPRPWVNHYAFHIMDRDWGHMIVRFCPHPPFNALVILNGHEWVAKEAERRRLAFRKQDNCFTELSNARDLDLVADALSSSESSVGRLVQAPERWIYSAVLCFALEIADQERTGFRYHYSLFQAEYSRNLLFRSGQQMDRVFGALIDRVRGPLDLRTVKTLFGRRQRPRRHKGQPRVPVVEVSLETQEVPLQAVGRQDPPFTPILRGPRSFTRDGRSPPAPQQSRAPTPCSGIHAPRRQGPAPAAPWTNATPPFITKCEASSTPLASLLERHPQPFHDL